MAQAEREKIVEFPRRRDSLRPDQAVDDEPIDLKAWFFLCEMKTSDADRNSKNEEVRCGVTYRQLVNRYGNEIEAYGIWKNLEPEKDQ